MEMGLLKFGVHVQDYYKWLDIAHELKTLNCFYDKWKAIEVRVGVY